MYSDDEERKGLPIKNFLISLILIIILVLLLMWLLPVPKTEGLNDRIFNANVQEMKNTAIVYFTKDKLPQDIDDSVTLTLQEMLDMKLMLPFTDKDGKACDTKTSYVTLTKKDDSYEMKVNLKCSEKEDYILVTLGCYSYCTSAVCEPEDPNKPTEDVKGPKCVLTVSGTFGENNWYKSDAVVKFKSKTTSTSGAKITNYGLGIGSINYNKLDSYTVSKEGTTTVYGWVKDSTGKTATCSVVVKKDTVKPSCDLAVLSGTKGSSGAYTSDVVIGFANKNDKTSNISKYGLTNSKTVTYNGKNTYTVNTNGTHTIYGYVKDTAGNTASCNITVKRDAVQLPSTPSCKLEITSGKLGQNNWYIGNAVVGFKSKTTTNGAKITGFGLINSKTPTYNGKTSFTVSGDGNNVIYGYVKDSNGNTATCSITVKKDATKPACTLKVTSGTLSNNGYYTSDVVIGFNSKKDSTSGINGYGLGKNETYANNNSYKVTSIGKHTIYGYVKDAAGNKATCSITVEKRGNIEYQYKKDIAATFSNWTDWQTLTYNPEKPPKFGSYTLIILEDLGKTREVAYYEYSKGDPIYSKVLVETGRVQQKSCKGWTYYKETETTTTTYATPVAGGDWRLVGSYLFTTGMPPADTISVKWEFVGFNWDNCGSDCTTTQNWIFNKYVRDVYTVTNDVITNKTTGYTAKCTEFETKETILYNTLRKLIGYESVRTPIYRDVYRYRRKIRSVATEAYTDYKWSYYNDKALLDAGYVLTGNTRVVD